MHHILIVDDRAADREAVGRIVEKHFGLSVEFASNGLDALEHLEAAAPLAVLTDLHMPEMDGLTLVQTMRRQYPTIPVVLLTDHGSEDDALEALVSGAADFVPKIHLAAELPRVLGGILAAVSGIHRHEEISRRLVYKQLRYQIESDPALIPPLVDQLQNATATFELFDRSDSVRLARCIAEAIHNAIEHGGKLIPNNGVHRSEVEVFAEFTREMARFVIRDQGPGFDHAALPNLCAANAAITDQTGRGLTLIRLFMDEVTFNPAGNEISLVKRKVTSTAAAQPTAIAR